MDNYLATEQAYKNGYKQGYKKGYADATKWIPVSEPPKERGCYLATVKHWLDWKPVVREAFWNGVDWLAPVKREEITPRVTHWMPLPPAPKEE